MPFDSSRPSGQKFRPAGRRELGSHCERGRPSLAARATLRAASAKVKSPKLASPPCVYVGRQLIELSRRLGSVGLQSAGRATRRRTPLAGRRDSGQTSREGGGGSWRGQRSRKATSVCLSYANEPTQMIFTGSGSSRLTRRKQDEEPIVFADSSNYRRRPIARHDGGC